MPTDWCGLGQSLVRLMQAALSQDRKGAYTGKRLAPEFYSLSYPIFVLQTLRSTGRPCLSENILVLLMYLLSCRKGLFVKQSRMVF